MSNNQDGIFTPSGIARNSFMARECILILGLAVTSTVGLKCYFCKSDYDSGVDADEEKTKDIPYCGEEPYGGNLEQSVVCDVYYDNFGMVNTTNLSRTTEVAKDRQSSTGKDYWKKKKKRSIIRNVTQSKWDLELTHPRVGENSTQVEWVQVEDDSRLSFTVAPISSELRSGLYKSIYPYNLSGEPWGSQRIHPRVKPYLCLTVHTINSTFPNRVCGLRYFLDCQLLEELTSEPLEPSSFVTSCYECNEDYCNTATRLEIGLGLYWLLNSVAMFCFYFSLISS